MVDRGRGAQEARLMAQARRLEPKVAKLFIEAIRRTSNSFGPAKMEALIQTIERGDVNLAAEMLEIRSADLFPLKEELRNAYMDGGRGVITKADISFDGSHDRALRWVDANVGDAIERITQAGIEVTRAVIREGLEAGENPRRVALEIVGRRNAQGVREGGYLGLTQRLQASISKGRSDLLSGNSERMREYLNLELRNKRYDPQINKAIREGRTITQTSVDKIIAAHKSKALRHRGENVARTETLTAMRAGRHEGFKQLVESGEVRDHQIKRYWDSSGDDGRTRSQHLLMDGQFALGMDSAFVMPDGSRMMFPGDTSLLAPPSQTINCRCIERIEIDYLSAEVAPVEVEW